MRRLTWRTGALAAGGAAAAMVALAGVPAVRSRAIYRLEQGAVALGIDRNWLKAWRPRGLAVAALAPLAATGASAAPPPPSMPVPPTVIAINVASPVWWDLERMFANLAVGGAWQVHLPSGWADVPPTIVAPDDGAILSLPAGTSLMRILTSPETGPGGKDIRCTFTGRGTIVGGGMVSGIQNGPNEVRYHLVNKWEPTFAWLTATAVAPDSKLEDLDCREAGLDRSATFAPSYLRALAAYGVIRFKDWQMVDGNKPQSWAGRHRPGAIDLTAADGVPIEDMLELSREVGADPWFSMPWNTDENYLRHFAQLVHDRLPPGHKVYVEVGNEVWNWSYPVTTQASKEGLAEKLTTDGNAAIPMRLAEKTIQVMKPWEQVFADRPGALVRVIAGQHVNNYEVEQLFAVRGLAAHVDALATAPYFGLDVKPSPDDPTLDRFFHDLDHAVDRTIDQAVSMKAIAYRFGKRYIAYEAGQHVLVPDIPLARRIQRDDRMFLIYRHYLSAWRTRVGDVLALFHTSSPIDGSGAWGLAEHDGQPLSETPKLRAVREFQAR